MFSLFKKQIHESIAKQREELLAHPMGPLAVSGEDCDQIKGGIGPFGHSYNNPIPVNGQLGTYKYLTKLRCLSGLPLLFHRLGSMASDVSKSSIDVYELVDVSGKEWDILFVSMYHPRRSNKAPSGYHLEPYDPSIGDHVFGLGVDVYCPNFPYDLADAVLSHNGFDSVAMRVREIVGISTHLRLPQQKMKMDAVSSRLEGQRAWRPLKSPEVSDSVTRAPISRILPSFVPVIFERGIPGYATEALIPGELRIPSQRLRPLLVASAFIGAWSHAGERGFDADKVQRLLVDSLRTIPTLSPSEAKVTLDLVDRFMSFKIVRAEHSLDNWLCEAWWPAFQAAPYSHPSAMSKIISYSLGIGSSLGKMILEY